jgi:hypothetical protein
MMEKRMKIVGIGSLVPVGGTVVGIQRDRVTVVDKGVKVVYTFAQVEKMFNV